MNVGKITQLTDNPSMQEKSIIFRGDLGKCHNLEVRSIDHLDFFRGVLDKTIKLSNDRDATCFASWKVGGQDFYVYGIEQKA